MMKLSKILLTGLIAASFWMEGGANSLFAQTKKEAQRYKIAVCDWMILKRQKIGSFALSQKLGADGVEVDLGSLGKRENFDNKLRDPEFQKLFNEKSAETGVEIASLAMSGFYGQPFTARQNFLEMVDECLNSMEAVGAKVVFLPLGVGCNLTQNPEARPEVVRLLKLAGDKAAKRGLTIGIETSLSAKEEVKLLKEIGSKGIKIYFKFQNALENGRDLCAELKTLGKKRICQIHCTDTDGVTLPNNERIDMALVKQTLDRMGWSGWLVVERSRDKNDVRNVEKNYGTNVSYLKEVFQSNKQ
jgi:sugar phosphate isomerase/epimerase